MREELPRFDDQLQRIVNEEGAELPLYSLHRVQRLAGISGVDLDDGRIRQQGAFVLVAARAQLDHRAFAKSPAKRFLRQQEFQQSLLAGREGGDPVLDEQRAR